MAGGVAWSYAGSAVVIVAQIVYTAFTARLLSPAEFGAYATAQALVALMGYFSLAPLGNALARMTVMRRTTVGTALLLATAAGIGAAGATLLLADLWSSVWDTREAAPLIALAAPGILLSSLAVIPLGLLRRRLRYAAVAGIESASPVIGFVVGGVLVFVLRSPSALIVGQVATAGAMLAAGIVVARRDIGLAFSRTEARSLLSFSSQVTGQNLAHYAFYTVPGLVIARTAGTAALGYFSRANLLVMLPMNFVTVGISKTIYPVIPQVTDTDARRRALSDVVAIGTFLVWPILGILAGSASLAVSILFGQGWDSAAAMVAPICLFAAVNLVYAILATSTESIGWLNLGWIIQSMWAVILVVWIFAAWRLDAGVQVYLYGFAIAQIAVHLIQLVLLSKRELVPLRSVFEHELVGGSMAALTFVVSLLANRFLDGFPLGIHISLMAPVVLGLGVAILFLLPRVAAGRALAQRDLLPRALARTAAGAATPT